MSESPVPTVEEIAERLRSEYNQAIAVYEYDGFVRFTNGSGGAMVDIRPTDGGFELVGRWYSREIDRMVDGDLETLVDEMSATI